MFSKAKSSTKKTKAIATPNTDVATAPITKRAAAPRPRNTSRPAGVPSIISSDMVIRGAIESDGEIQFDGEIDGNIISKGLVIGEGSKVVGEIIADKVRVCGTVEGSIKGIQVELASSANVKGDIVHSSLSIENGARFDGNCRHSDDPAGSSKPSSKPRPIPSPQKIDASALQHEKAPHATPRREETVDVEMAAELESHPTTPHELMPTRAEPAPDRAFVTSKAVGDLR